MAGPSSADAVPAEDNVREGSVLGPGRVEDYWDEPDPPESEAGADLEELQGAWVSVSGRRPAEFLIAGHHFTIRFQDGAIYMGAFDLGQGARPKTMDMRIDEGPARHQGKTALCISSWPAAPCAGAPSSRARGNGPALSPSRTTRIIWRYVSGGSSRPDRERGWAFPTAGRSTRP